MITTLATSQNQGKKKENTAWMDVKTFKNPISLANIGLKDKL
jgi:hypothetical protein